MAIKANISATEYQSLSDELKSEYMLQPDMSYKLDLGEGVFITDKDPTGLKSALEAEREETRKAKAAANRLEKEKLEAERSKLTDADEIKAHYEAELAKERKKIADEKKADEERRAQAQQQVADQMRRTKALEIASSLFGTSAPLMLPHVEAMLQPVAGETPTVQIIDPSTGLPALDQNFDNFKNSLSTNPLFEPMVVVSKASGGSANGGKSSGLPTGTRDDGKPKTYSDYRPDELLAIKRENPEKFKALKSTKGT